LSFVPFLRRAAIIASLTLFLLSSVAGFARGVEFPLVSFEVTLFVAGFLPVLLPDAS
jgi:hypothetical protein